MEVDADLTGRSRYFIPNAIDWLEDLEAQITRDDLVDATDLELEEILLYGDVLAKLEPMVNRMNTRLKDRAVRLRFLDDLPANYLDVPPVLANRKALDCVFRNLLDNSRRVLSTT